MTVRPEFEIVVRPETPGDHSGIRAVNEAAFGTSDEADIVEKLRDEGVVLTSLVAEEDGQIVGHILFSRMWIDSPAGDVEAVALAPMAVLPDHQRRGIGGRLIRTGLEVLRSRDERAVIVVGHASYYPRFGFSSDLARSFEHPFPPDAFMALELRPGALEGVRGRVLYPSAFGL